MILLRKVEMTPEELTLAEVELIEERFPHISSFSSPAELEAARQQLYSARVGATEATLEETEDFRKSFYENPGKVLIQEGVTNDLSFLVNRLRREHQLNVSDNIHLEIVAGAEVSWAIYWNLGELMASTKTSQLTLNATAPGNISSDFTELEVQTVSHKTTIHARII